MKIKSINIKMLLCGVAACLLYALLDVVFEIVNSDALAADFWKALFEWLTIAGNTLFFALLLSFVFYQITEKGCRETISLFVIVAEMLFLRPLLLLGVYAVFFPVTASSAFSFLEESLVEGLVEILFFALCICFLLWMLRRSQKNLALAQASALHCGQIPPREISYLPFTSLLDFKNPVNKAMVFSSLCFLAPTILEDIGLYSLPATAKGAALLILYYARDILLCGVALYGMMHLTIQKIKKTK